MIALIIDTETTGVDEEDQVIELAYRSFGSTEAPTVERFFPTEGVKMKWGALATHHILPQDLQGQPSSLSAKLPPADYIIGHNVDFDWKMLGRPPVLRICTLALSRRLWPELDAHTLVAMIYFIKGANDRTRELVRWAHGAEEDVLLTVVLLDAIMKHVGIDNIPELWIMSEDARIPRKMTFGKFKGEPVSAVDRGYANWYRKQPDTDPYVLEAFKREGLI